MSSNKTKDEKKNIKNQWKLKSQLVLISSTTTLFGSRDDRRGKRTPKIFKFCESLCQLSL
jgi:hypothetical protein